MGQPHIGRDFDRQEFCGDYEREEVASERIFARIRAALTRGRRRRILFRVAAVLIPSRWCWASPCASTVR